MRHRSHPRLAGTFAPPSSSILGTQAVNDPRSVSSLNTKKGDFHVMRHLIPDTCIVLALAAIGYSQSFEVASIEVLARENSGERRGPPVIEPTPGNLVMRNV